MKKTISVLIANEPLSYREVMAVTLQELRPEVEVLTSDPADLEREILRLGPDLVICSQAPVVAHPNLLTCVVMYPDGENRAEVTTDGRCVNVPGIEFGDLLSIIDDTVLLGRDRALSTSSRSGRQTAGSITRA